MKSDSTTIDRDSPAGGWEGALDESPGLPIDLNDLQSVAVLCVPAGSRVVVAGLGDGTVARTLGARMCRVWGVEPDADAARAAAPWCERILDGEPATLDCQTALGGECGDAILILNGLERSSDPANVLRRLVTLLAAGGRVVLAVPDAVHLVPEVVDRATAYELLQQAGLAVIDEILLGDPIEQEGTHAGLRYLLIAAPAADPAAETMPALAGAVMHQLQRLEHKYRRLDLNARGLERQLAHQHTVNGELRAALEEARDWHRQSAESVSIGADTLRREVAERERLEQQLGATAEELEQSRVERRFLRDDLAVKDAYLASLREANARHVEADRQRELAQREQQLERHQWEVASEAQRVQQEHEHDAHRRQWDDRVRALTRSLDTTVSERDAEANRAAQLEAANERLRQHIVSVQDELHRVHVAVGETLAQPRYVLADRVNSWARRIRIIHRPLKRLWLG